MSQTCISATHREPPSGLSAITTVFPGPQDAPWFLLEILEKNSDECILILVIYWKKTGLLHTKISNHNIIYSSQKPRKLLSLPLKSSSWLFSLDAGMCIYKSGNNTYPQCISCRSNLGHIFRGKKKCVLWAGKHGNFFVYMVDGYVGKPSFVIYICNFILFIKFFDTLFMFMTKITSF
jgi:hypothetical protein